MWMSQQWNGAPDAFRYLTTLIMILIFVAMPEGDIAGAE